MNKYEYLKLFGLPMLYSNNRDIKNDMPKGWYYYELRSSYHDPSFYLTLEDEVKGNNYGGSVISYEVVRFDTELFRTINNWIGFFGEQLTLPEFCEINDIPL